MVHKEMSIIWRSNLLIVSVPYEGYSSNASPALNLISTCLLTGIEMNMTLVCPHFIENN